MNLQKNNELLLALQKGIPLEPRPFKALGNQIGLSEEDVLSQIKILFDDGRARRLGGIFDARRLGYKSALCSLMAAPDNSDHLASIVSSHPGVTHCYLRGWPEELDPSLPCAPGHDVYPTLWFTLAVPADDFDSEVNKIRTAAAPAELLVLPAIRRFKIDVIFDTRERDKGERFPGAAPTATEETVEKFHSFSEKEKALVRLMDGNIPITKTPFSDIANQIAMDEKELLSLLNSWEKAGILRRTAAILRHNKLGFKANAMCLWSVHEENVVKSGRALAANPEVTHCYQRPLHPLFNYNLFAMIHTQSWEKTHLLFLKIAENAGLSDGKMLCSVKEFKKTSMKFFQ